eukprot:13467144-Alexandrium_andersonii.AAC.1
MSASLVGSEMCIRDRANGAGPQILQRFGHFDSEVPQTTGASVGTEAEGCLLYTSDAADDM